MEKGHLSKPAMIFSLGWLLSFVGGCTAKAAYIFFNAPEWSNSVIGGLFVGLTCFFMSFAMVTSSSNFDWRVTTAQNKAKAIYSLIIGTVIFGVGLFVFWQVFLNLQALLSR